MLRLFKVKDDLDKQREANGRAPVKKQSPGELRLNKGFYSPSLQLSISFPNGKDELMNFEVNIRPDEGYYSPPTYPHEAPKFKCKIKVGFFYGAFNKVTLFTILILTRREISRLNILREDWKTVFNINTVIYGLNFLFKHPNHEDPLNHEEAAVLRDNPKTFEANVRRVMTGGYVGNTTFS
ncbi:hypothetical protein MKW92_028221 [Papaver armeniacum]|nr:hypothetical protein MKW92_028221 [Papaver armeniacum]